MNLDVSRPAEPVELKSEIAARTEDTRFTLDADHDWVVPVKEPAPGRLVVGTDFAAHVWRAWESELRRVGFTFPQFVTATSYVAATVGRWATDETDWETVVSELESQLQELGPVLLADL